MGVRPLRVLSLGGAVVAAAVLAAACSSSAKSSGGSSSSSGTPSTSAPAGATNAVSIETHSGPQGTFLTDASGKSLYMFASDTATKSSCTGACATFWPPLTTSAAPTASGGATASMLTTITRSDGTKQVVYAGHPLYYYKLDTAAGQTNGQGSDNFGAMWWLLAPSGQPITSSSSSSSSSSAGGGGGGWS
jgi:predicted lipoprotein with Yx(FWY)xxD motif